MRAENLEHAAISAQVLLPLYATIEMVMISSAWGNA